MGQEGWDPEPGIWLLQMTLDELSGLTLVEIGPDKSVRVLGPGRGVYLFRTRRGMADFLASGERHSLQGRLGDHDPMTDEVEFGAYFDQLRDTNPLSDSTEAYLWLQCLLILDACGIDNSPSIEWAARQVAAVTTVRDEFERPGYRELDYWMNGEVFPTELTLPSGTGYTLVAPMSFWDPSARVQAFLGDAGEVLMFSNADDLLAHVRGDGTDDMRRASWWPVNPPNCVPQRFVDVREADPRDIEADAYDYLRGLATVLTKRAKNLPYSRPGRLAMGRAEDRVLDVMLEVDRKVTWR
jgi:hypothetical protein